MRTTTRSTRSTRSALSRLGAGLALAATLGLGLTACGTEGEDTAAASSTSGSTSGSTSDADADEAGTESAVGAGVVVGDPWVRATVGSEDTSMSAAFMTLDNPADQDVALVGASSPVAGMVELHEMAMVDGTMAMQEVQDGIVLEAGRGKVLEPGGFYVMLMDLQTELAAGDEVDLTLEFSDGSVQEMTVVVKEFTEEEGHYHAPGTGEHDHDEDGEMEMESSDS